MRHKVALMTILILFHPSDLQHAYALERHLINFSTNGQHTINSIEVPYEAADEITDQLDKANTILLLISQNFLADSTCYQYALSAQNISSSKPELKVINISISPNNVEETALSRIKRLPKEHTSISQYKDVNQGYWDTYQGIKAIIEPGYTYKKRPIIATLHALKSLMAVLTIWSIFILLLPVLFPQDGVKVVKRPIWTPLDSNLYYKLYKIGAQKHKNVVLSFVLNEAETAQFEPQIGLYLHKVNAKEWTQPHNTMSNAISLDGYSALCTTVDFDANDEGEYYLPVQFGKALLQENMPNFEGKLIWGNAYCTSPEVNNEGIGYFELYHYLYFKTAKLYAILAIFAFASIFSLIAFNIHKKTSYA